VEEDGSDELWLLDPDRTSALRSGDGVELDRDPLLQGQQLDDVATVTPATPSQSPRRSETTAEGLEEDGPLNPVANPGEWPTMQSSPEQSTRRSR
jgi:hypothetical protein